MPKSDDRLSRQFKKSAEFGNFLGYLGRSGANVARTARRTERLGERLKERGIDIDEFDIQEEFDPEDAPRFAREFRDRGGQKKQPRKSRLMKEAQEVEGRERVEESQKFFEEEVEPGFEQAQQLMDEILASPAFSPQFLAQSRSNIARQVKEAEENRLTRVGASLGLRGIAPGSPVAAALASQAAEESDQFLVDQLRQQGMQAEQIERSSQLMEITQQQNLAQSRIAARTAALQGDRDRLAAINNEMAGTFESLRQQRELMAMLGELQRGGGDSGLAGGLAGAFSGAMTGAQAGPWGALAGGVAGGALGATGNLGTVNAMSQGMGGFQGFGGGGGSSPSMPVGTYPGRSQPGLGTNFFA